jgi:iron complex transport system substrate-binding protein
VRSLCISWLVATLCLSCAREGSQECLGGAKHQKIVSLAPSITEILFAVGAGEKVVGVTTYCNYPPEAAKIIKIGEFTNIDIEKIIALKPDLAIGTKDGNPPEVLERLRKLGIRVETFQPATFQEICESIVEIGKLVEEESNARALRDQMEKKCEEITVSRPARSPGVLLLYGSEPLIAAGKGSIGDELIRLAGGNNIMADSSGPYIATNIENIVAKNPEVIVELSMGTEKNSAEIARKRWARWQSISAVKKNRIHILDPDLVCRPGPRIVEGLKLIAQAIREAAQMPSIGEE